MIWRGLFSRSDSSGVFPLVLIFIADVAFEPFECVLRFCRSAFVSLVISGEIPFCLSSLSNRLNSLINADPSSESL